MSGFMLKTSRVVRWTLGRATGDLGAVLRGIGKFARRGKSTAHLDAKSVLRDQGAENGTIVLRVRGLTRSL
jgi:hypothetical protein